MTLKRLDIQHKTDRLIKVLDYILSYRQSCRKADKILTNIKQFWCEEGKATTRDIDFCWKKAKDETERHFIEEDRRIPKKTRITDNYTISKAIQWNKS